MKLVTGAGPKALRGAGPGPAGHRQVRPDGAAQGDEVVPEPSVLEHRHVLRLEPRLEDLVVREVRLAGLDAGAHTLGAHAVDSRPIGLAATQLLLRELQYFLMASLIPIGIESIGEKVRFSGDVPSLVNGVARATGQITP